MLPNCKNDLEVRRQDLNHFFSSSLDPFLGLGSSGLEMHQV